MFRAAIFEYSVLLQNVNKVTDCQIGRYSSSLKNLFDDFFQTWSSVKSSAKNYATDATFETKVSILLLYVSRANREVLCRNGRVRFLNC